MGDFFAPNCKLDKTRSSEGLEVWVCRPAGELNGKMYQAKEPITMFSGGKNKSLENDGGLPAPIVEKLMKWADKHM
jgi:hypothetical protein